VWRLAFILLFVCSLSASDKATPPTFVVDAHGNPWLVRFASSIEMTEWGGQYVGFTDDETHEIRLLQGRSLVADQETLLHELMHVVVGTDHSNELARIHWCIYEFSEGLEAIFVENPDLMRYLAKREYEN
jgi:hypothetical protein